MCQLRPTLGSLVEADAQSDIAAGVEVDGEELSREVIWSGDGVSQQRNRNEEGGGNRAVRNELPGRVPETMLRGRKWANQWTQFMVSAERLRICIAIRCCVY